MKLFTILLAVLPAALAVAVVRPPIMIPHAHHSYNTIALPANNSSHPGRSRTTRRYMLQLLPKGQPVRQELRDLRELPNKRVVRRAFES